ncbi:MAG: 4Fe-4S binding protein [Candidatus Hermodarchaeota archaeon]
MFSRKKCISCLCCMELCPENAIKSRSRGIIGLFDYFNLFVSLILNNFLKNNNKII